MGEFLHLKDLLHTVAQGLLYPTMIILILLILFAIVLLASVIVEAVVERRHFKVALPQLIAKVDACEYGELPEVIEASGLLRSQKSMLRTMVAYGYLPDEARVALAKRLISQEEQRYLRITSRTDLVAKASPMIGLMGTLIPLGPGIVAMGQGQVDLLASSIEIAFDTTIAGLVVAVIAMFVGRFRKGWYEDYLVAEESVMSAILEKASACVAAGQNIGNAEEAAKVEAQLSQPKKPKGAAETDPKAAPKSQGPSTEAR